jgi:hypothetical protein
VAGRTPAVARGLEPFGRPQLELLLAGLVPGVQLGTQQPAHQMVVPEAGLRIVERHQEQLGGADGAQQRRRVQPPGDGRARIAVSSPRMEMSSMNWAISEGCCSSTSETKNSASACPRTSSARVIRAGSAVPRSDSAAICTAAAHPSVL